MGGPDSLDAGELTPADERSVHSFISFTEEQARAQAEAVDRKIAAGEDPGPLGGDSFLGERYILRARNVLYGGLAHPGQFPRPVHCHFA